jgi:hypothetical protein
MREKPTNAIIIQPVYLLCISSAFWNMLNWRAVERILRTSNMVNNMAYIDTTFVYLLFAIIIET